MTTGDDLFALVSAYDALGIKRTGGPAEDAVVAWMRDQLERRGATVEAQHYDLQRWHEDLSVTVDGDPVPAVTLPWSGTGEATIEAPEVQPLQLLAGLFPIDLYDVIAAAGDVPVLVAATPTTHGEVIGINRAHTTPSGPTVVLVGGDDAERVAERGRVAVRTWTSSGRSSNLVARLGTADGRAPIVLVTPLTGWFHCAAERGCGIAITLELTTRLAASHPVEVVATTGHELEYVGGEAALAARSGTPTAVVHLGASMAALDTGPDGDRSLAVSRFAQFDPGDHTSLAEPVAEVLATVGLGMLDLPEWPGEGQDWRRYDCPVLSITGGFDRFHAPSDRAELTTSPAALAQVWDATTRAVDLVVAALDTGATP